MPIQRILKRRRVDDGEGTIASDAVAPIASMRRDVSPPPRSEETPLNTTKNGDGSGNGPAMAPRPPNDSPRDHRMQSGRPESDPARNAALAAIARFEGKKVDFISEGEHASQSSMTQNSLRSSHPEKTSKSMKVLPSPFQLTKIRDLPDAQNVDTITLHDILGHPLLAQCWQFNYLHSIPFIIEHMDEDVRPQVKLRVVHGFWKNDDQRRRTLEAQAAAVKDQIGEVKLIAAHMPEMFGTHHSKMMILIRHDGVAQVVIHTANMIPQDWTNLTQAVWRSPELPLLPDGIDADADAGDGDYHPIESGLRFKADLLKYLKAYEGRTKSLVSELRKYDFSAVKAALVSSTPSKVSPQTHPEHETTSFGWPGLKQVLSEIPMSTKLGSSEEVQPAINVQISSVATLTENWINNFFDVLMTSKKSLPSNPNLPNRRKPKFNVIFPTAEEIRKSLDGYSSGDSIHWKIQSAARQKQLALLKPKLCHWHGNFKESASSSSDATRSLAFRNPAAPHIKTYIRFADANHNNIDWAMITSANLSKQAWGDVVDKNNQVRIASYEIGVMFWPELFKGGDDAGNVRMVPTFGKDVPDASHADDDTNVLVGVRMPYDLPLVSFGKNDVPWCATMGHKEPDWMGNTWGGYENRM